MTKKVLISCSEEIAKSAQAGGQLFCEDEAGTKERQGFELGLKLCNTFLVERIDAYLSTGSGEQQH
jgi:hypothetical protein